DTYSIAEISPKTASLLNQPENSVIIYSERLAYLSDGTPAEFVESVIRADKFKLEVDYKSHEKDDKASSSVEVNFRI
ncbi:MAG: UTRA domain-containing protein, partial [Hungatella hathewayi]|nr:UTRA domain-containing protein [Hungatella hathewayi]